MGYSQKDEKRTHMRVGWMRRILILAIALTACTPSKRVVYDSIQSFPPDETEGLCILLVNPIEEIDLRQVRDKLILDYDTPEKALAKVKQRWGNRIENRVKTSPKIGVSFRSEVMRDDLPEWKSTDTWISYEFDELGVPEFVVSDGSVLKRYAEEGIDFIAVPLSLSPGTQIEGGQVVVTQGIGQPMGYYQTPIYNRNLIRTPVAVIEAGSGDVLWVGVVDSSRWGYSSGQRGFLTEIEGWCGDLLEVFGETLPLPGQGRPSGRRIGG